MFQKLFKESGLGIIVVILLVAFGIYYFSSYLTTKAAPKQKKETMMNARNTAYTGGAFNPTDMAVQPSNPLGQNEVFSEINGVQTSMPTVPSSCGGSTIHDPAELLPHDSNKEWAQLNPSGMGELSNVNLLKAGYHIGIDTIGQTLRNANLQIRSEPPNPQLSVGPWNISTITPDFMRPPLEIGGGAQ